MASTVTRYWKRYFRLVLVVAAAVIFVIVFYLEGLFIDSKWTVRNQTSTVPTTPTRPTSLRLHHDTVCSSSRDFQETSRNLPLRKYVSTRRKQNPAGRTKPNQTAAVIPNKNDVRVVEYPRSSIRSLRNLQELPTAYVITPTYARQTQKADLLHLCYTLMHVPRLHWIVVEDSAEKTVLVTEVLANCRGPAVTHLAARNNKKKTHRGVAQRNAALNWIRRCVMPSPTAGGLFFGDDDNTYDLLLFEAVRWTTKVSVWPVGIVGGALWEGPACLNDKVIGFEGRVSRARIFPVDMASFSVGVGFFLSKPKVAFDHHWPKGRLETRFLESLSVSRKDLTVEPDANCSQVLAWHTKTQNRNFPLPKKKT